MGMRLIGGRMEKTTTASMDIHNPCLQSSYLSNPLRRSIPVSPSLHFRRTQEVSLPRQMRLANWWFAKLMRSRHQDQRPDLRRMGGDQILVAAEKGRYEHLYPGVEGQPDIILHVASEDLPVLLQQAPKSLAQGSATVLRGLLDPALEGKTNHPSA